MNFPCTHLCKAEARKVVSTAFSVWVRLNATFSPHVDTSYKTWISLFASVRIWLTSESCKKFEASLRKYFSRIGQLTLTPIEINTCTRGKKRIFEFWFWWLQLVAYRSLKFAPSRGGWGERSCPRSATAILSMAPGSNTQPYIWEADTPALSYRRPTTR